MPVYKPLNPRLCDAALIIMAAVCFFAVVYWPVVLIHIRP